jgi:hypothetical protein
LLRPLPVNPRNSIARDQRPLRVKPKSARTIPRRLIRPLSTMAMSMLFRRLDVPSPFCARHRQQRDPLLRTSMLELRRPILASWASFVCGETGDNVVELRRAGA